MMLLAIPTSLKVIQVMLISSIKFFFSIPLALGLGFSWWETFLISVSGGLAGLFVFYFLTPLLLKTLRIFIEYLRFIFGRRKHKTKKKKHKKKFTRRNKFIIHIRGKFGLIGIALLTPIILSIPLGAILANKYYRRHRLTLVVLSLSVILWSLLLISIFYLPRF